MDFDLNSGLLTMNLALLAWIKMDQISLWKRLNNHTHDAECENDKKCKVIIGGVMSRE